MTRHALSRIAIAMALASSASFVHAAPLLEASSNDVPAAARMAQSNAWLEIDQVAFEHNIARIQKLVAGKSQVCAVMKADAYGNGIALLVPSAIRMGIGCIGVASNEEARVAREKGFKGRLMRLRTASLGEVQDALPYDMDELVGNLEVAQQLDALAKRSGHPLKVHLALNSAGMGRNGVEMGTPQGRKDAIAMATLAHLQVVGIMTHFPEEAREDVLKGLATFKEQSALLIEQAKLDRSKLLLHCANTFTTLEVPEGWLDMVRPGAALYGYPVGGHEEFQRVMQFKSQVAAVNRYPAGSTISYDRTYTLNRDSLVANIPAGYSDGYRRAFSNKASVLINGKRAPVIGKVTMNTLMVDVTDIPGVKPGNEVVLYGKQGDQEITQAELETINGALLADLYTIWGNSNPKVLKAQ
ncbi:alanine racemase [Pseudomonas putida]|uniref:Broad specificity amino-acid racemase n=1 Tax=Pseudomonas putida TaxID=303 RepID=A0AA37VNT1_PSEPU|nr:alanine racemase [Pseudomonas putida]GLO15796.1 alanine racemase [Pseudomonas putida]GLO37486.1 alanine racemase [Pseudomonas putida]HDS0966715.1 alanine racemase [Pseudomonas putida]HDS0993108.1 alanine racemase [Pseudomonas putida]